MSVITSTECSVFVFYLFFVVFTGACGEMINKDYDITQPKYKECTVSFTIIVLTNYILIDIRNLPPFYP